MTASDEASAPVVVRIAEGGARPAELFIHDPPDALRRHRSGPCLQLLAPPEHRWFRVHFDQPPADAWQAYAFIQGMLDEAVTGAAPRIPHDGRLTAVERSAPTRSGATRSRTATLFVWARRLLASKSP